jgi:hypothetical protein
MLWGVTECNGKKTKADISVLDTGLFFLFFVSNRSFLLGNLFCCFRSQVTLGRIVAAESAGYPIMVRSFRDSIIEPELNANKTQLV